MNKRIVAVVAALAVAVSAASAKKNKDKDKNSDGEYWTFSDVQSVCDDLIKMCGESDVVKMFVYDNGRPLRVKIDTIKNSSTERTNTRLIEECLSDAVMNSSVLTFPKEEVYGEYEAADCLLMGDVSVDVVPTGKKGIGEKTYRVDIELVSIMNVDTLASFYNDQVRKRVKY